MVLGKLLPKVWPEGERAQIDSPSAAWSARGALQRKVFHFKKNNWLRWPDGVARLKSLAYDALEIVDQKGCMVSSISNSEKHGQPVQAKCQDFLSVWLLPRELTQELASLNALRKRNLWFFWWTEKEFLVRPQQAILFRSSTAVARTGLSKKVCARKYLVDLWILL